MRWTVRALAVAGLGLTVATCRDGMEPQVHLAPIAVAPVLPSDAALASFGLAIDRVRFIVVRPSAPPDTLADTTVALPPDSATLDLDLRVPLIAAAETLQVSVIVLSGTIPLFEGTAPVEVLAGAAPATPTEIPVQTYVGPGAGVDSIAVSPAVPFIFFNDSVRFQVEAFQAGVPVSQFYVSWTTSDTNVARVNGAGVLRAPAARTSVRVIARTPGGAASDSTTATFVPFPTQLVIIAGGGQTGGIGQTLPTQLEVEVRALDNLPVPGVDVRFRSLSGGAPADTTVTSDAQGRARVTGALGGTPGPQAFQASLPAFPGITASFNATATGVVISPVTSVVTVASGSVISGNTVKLRLQGKDASGADITTGGATVAFTRSGGTSTGSISASADSGNGVYTAVFTGVLAGTATTIGATINGSPVTSALPTIAVSPGGISHTMSVVTVSDDTVASGDSVMLRLQGKDAAGNDVTTGGATVSFTLIGGSGNGTMGTTADSGNGIYTAMFTGVAAGSSGLVGAFIDGNQHPFAGLPALTVIPGAPARVAFLSPIAGVMPGFPIAPAVEVYVRDVAGNRTPTFNGDITMAIGDNPSGGSLSGTVTQPTVAGIATFADLVLDLPGNPYTLIASATGLASDTTLPFSVAPPAGTIFWANAAGGNWSNPANWAGGAVPGPTEIANISVPGTYTVTLDVGDTIAGLQLGASSGTQTLLTASWPLHVSGTAQVNANGVLDWRASVLSGGTLTNAGTLQVNGSSTFDIGVVTTSTSRIRVQGNGIYGAAVLTVANSFTNNGAIVLTDTSGAFGATLLMPVGATLTNGPGGTIDAAVGAAGPRTLTVTLDNQGTVTLNRALTLNRTGTAQTNSGTINVTGGDLTISQTGLGSTFTTSGTISIAAGRAVLLTGGSFDYAAGTIAGSGTLSLTTTNVTITPTLSTGSVGVSLASVTVGGGGTLMVAPSTALEIKASTISAAFVNQGLVTVNGSSVLNGALTNAAGATLRAQGNGIYGAALLTVANSFTNDGVVVLTDTSGAFGATLSMPAGATLTNGPGATIDAAVGAAGPRTLTLALNNQGTVNLNRPLTINRGAAVHTNSGTINVSGGDLTLSQSGGGSSFTMAGSGAVNVAPTRTFAITGGALNYNAGTISGGGALIITSAVVTSTQGFNTATAALSLISSTWGGSGALTVSSGTALDVRASTITAPLANQADIKVTGSSAFSGGFTNPLGSTLTVQGNGIYGAAFLTVGTSFTNGGAIVLTDTSGAFGTTLTMPAGATLTNALGATVEAAVGFAGPRTLALELSNQGSVMLNRPLTLSRADATHLNSGTIDVSGGDFTLTQTGASASFTTSGSIPIATGRAVVVTGGAFNYNAGAISGGTFSVTSTNVTATQDFSTATSALSLASSTWGGTGTLTVSTGTTLLVRASTINAPLVNQNLMVTTGSSAFTDTVVNVPGATLRVQGNGTYGQGILTVANGFTNDGAIELTDTSGAFGATLTVSSGTLLNASSATVSALAGANGSRALNAQLDNRGTITVATAPNQLLTINKVGADHLNGGAIVVSSGDLTITQSGTTPTFTNDGSVTIGAGDTVRINNGAFSHDSGTLSGAGTFSLASVNASFNATQTVAEMLVSNSTVSFATPQNTGATGFEFLSTTINGPGTFTNDLGKTLILRSSIVNTPLDNQGTLLATGATNINDTLTTGTSSLIRLQGNGTYGSVGLTVTNGFENAGTIELTDTSGAFGSTLAVTNGKLVNLPGAFVNAVAGANGPRSLTAALDNQGVVAVSLLPGRDLVISRTNSVHTNSGTIDITGGDLTISAATSFQNLGAINIGGSDTLSITNGAFSFDAGTLGTGTLVLSFVSPANFNKPHTLSSINLNNTTANFAVDQSTATTDFALSNSSVLNGPGTLTNAAAETLKVQGSAITAPLINQGTILASGASSLDALTTMAGSTLRLQGNGQVGTATLTVPNGLINNGTIELTDTSGAFGATLVVKTLPLVNVGTVDIQPGANGPRTIDAVGLDNQGTITGNHPVTFSHTDAVHTNRGTIKVKAGSITFAQSGTNASFTNQLNGIIDIDAGTAFRVTYSGASTSFINSLGAKILGFGTLDVRPPVIFSNDGEIIPGASPGKLTIAGNMQIPATGIVTIELGGSTPGTEYDQLAVTGAASFAEGTINVSTIGVFDPKGLSFDVMTFGPGSFTGLPRNFTVPTGCDPQPVNTGTSIRVICP